MVWGPVGVDAVLIGDDLPGLESELANHRKFYSVTVSSTCTVGTRLRLSTGGNLN